MCCYRKSRSLDVKSSVTGIDERRYFARQLVDSLDGDRVVAVYNLIGIYLSASSNCGARRPWTSERRKSVGRSPRILARHTPDAREYEMMIVIAPTVTEEGLPAAVERVTGYVTDQGGEVQSVTHEPPWGRRRLAYSIQNFTDAFYVLYYFSSPPAAIEEIERSLRLDSVVIRHLVIKYDPLAGRPVDESEAAAVPAGVAAEESDEVVAEEPAAPASPAPEEAPAAVAQATEETGEESTAESVEAEEPAPASAAEPEDEAVEDETVEDETVEGEAAVEADTADDDNEQDIETDTDEDEEESEKEDA